jgi:DNA modification methylase
MRARILVGDCRESMATLEAESVDAVVCDPPYELGFMGRKWDASGIAYDLEVWRQALRVLKPGGHLLAFSGSRTYHRMACAIEDAGFDVRDQIMWIYGSGFPKSLDVSKAIHKIDRIGPMEARARTFTAWMRSTGITAQQVNDATGSFMGSHYLTDKSQPSVATADLFDLLRPLLPPVPDEIEELVRSRTVESENMKRREVLATRTDTGGRSVSIVGRSVASEFNVTAPATDDARRWSGWGTALKPAHEPICMARKPLVGTVAANVLRYGTGAINVDGCRVGDEKPAMDGYKHPHNYSEGVTWVSRERVVPDSMPAGRWPANVLHDGSDEATEGLRDAARFFYTAKADRSDREEVIGDVPRRRPPAVECQGDFGKKGLNSPRAGAGRTARDLVNIHPTVKPTDLMRYLVRMVTPPGGLVLDPFTGSGSTGRAAMLEGMSFVGCELSPEYAEIARARIRFTLGPLFAHLVE